MLLLQQQIQKRDVSQRGVRITSVIRSFSETGLPAPLASRFDIIWMMRDEVKAENDEMIAQHILRSRTRGVPEALIDEQVEMDPTKEDDDKVFDKGVDGIPNILLPHF